MALTWRAGVFEAIAATFVRPDAWPVALAGFLVRGGILPFLAPIVVLPTLAGLSIALAPDVISVALAGPNPRVIGLAIAIGAIFLGWLATSALLGAAADVTLARAAADELGGTLAPPGGAIRRTAFVRLACLVPLGLAISAGIVPLVAASYHQLVLPDDVRVPLALRVIREAPGPVTVIVGAWLACEVVGALAARAIALDGRGAGASIGVGIVLAIRRLPPVLATLLGSLGLSLLLIAPALVAAGPIWLRLRAAMAADAPPSTILAGAALLSLVWAGGLVLASVAATLRHFLWTAEYLRSR